MGKWREEEDGAFAAVKLRRTNQRQTQQTLSETYEHKSTPNQNAKNNWKIWALDHTINVIILARAPFINSWAVFNKRRRNVVAGRRRSSQRRRN